MQLIQNCALTVLLSMLAGVACAAPAGGDEAAKPEEAITHVRSAAKFLQDKGVRFRCAQQQGWALGLERQLRLCV
jgi:hypothetical protein